MSPSNRFDHKSLCVAKVDFPQPDGPVCITSASSPSLKRSSIASAKNSFCITTTRSLQGSNSRSHRAEKPQDFGLREDRRQTLWSLCPDNVM